MSLLFIGYETEKIDFSKFKSSTNTVVNREPYISDKGIFAIADSAITTFQGGKTLLTGFRKIYEIEARIWKPSFYPDGSFNDYFNINQTIPLIIGFAGNTLVAQHIINSITGHLEHLKISCKERDGIGPVEYIVNLPCKKNILISPKMLTQWDDDTFLPSDYENIVSGEFLSDTIEHSINHAIESARKHRLDENEFKQMFTDVFCGIYCPQKKEHQIYIFRMKSKIDKEGIIIAYTEKEKLIKDKIAVLGMRKDFESEAQRLYTEALEQNISPSVVFKKYMKQCIDIVHEKGSFEINTPIVYKHLDRFQIKKITIQ